MSETMTRKGRIINMKTKHHSKLNTKKYKNLKNMEIFYEEYTDLVCPGERVNKIRESLLLEVEESLPRERRSSLYKIRANLETSVASSTTKGGIVSKSVNLKGKRRESVIPNKNAKRMIFKSQSSSIGTIPSGAIIPDIKIKRISVAMKKIKVTSEWGETDSGKVTKESGTKRNQMKKALLFIQQLGKKQRALVRGTPKRKRGRQTQISLSPGQRREAGMSIDLFNLIKSTKPPMNENETEKPAPVSINKKSSVYGALMSLRPPMQASPFSNTGNSTCSSEASGSPMIDLIQKEEERTVHPPNVPFVPTTAIEKTLINLKLIDNLNRLSTAVPFPEVYGSLRPTKAQHRRKTTATSGKSGDPLQLKIMQCEKGIKEEEEQKKRER